MSLNTARDALWLVIDVLDDLLERNADGLDHEQLAALRGGVLDLLFGVRRAEVKQYEALTAIPVVWRPRPPG